MSDINDILSFDEAANDKSKKLSEDKLQAYLEGRLSAEEQHELELWLSEEGMESDALEGLKQIKPEETKQSVGKINHQLRKHLTGKKRKRKEPIKENKWAWVAVLLILLLIVLAFVVLKMAA